MKLCIHSSTIRPIISLLRRYCNAARTTCFLAILMMTPVQAGQLMSENWNAGRIDPEKWNLATGGKGKIEVVELEESDYALAIWDDQGPANGLSVWNTSIVSRRTFPRGGNLRVTFKAWWDKTKSGTGGQLSADPPSFNAPWHSTFYELASYFTLEATLTTGRYTYGENRTAGQRALADREVFAAAWRKATSKEKALTLRFHLGDKTGAAFEWNDSSSWQTSFDTRGEPADLSPYRKGDGVGVDSFGNQRATGINISSSPRARVGFVAIQNLTMIDDLVVENDLSESEYTKLEARVPTAVAGTIKKDPTPWTHLNYKNDPKNFQFVITSDLTGGERPGVFEDAVKKVNLLQPEFVITVGDLVEGYIEIDHLLQRQFDEFDLKVARLKMPFYCVPGNHDVSNQAMQDKWREHYGRDYYHFLYKEVLFLCLNTTDGPHYRIGEEQIQYFAGVLAKHKNVCWTMVFMHDPIWIYDWKTGWKKMGALLKDRPHTAFAGHVHLYAKTYQHNREYYILATTGGSSTLSGVQVDGQFDHIMWVTMTDQGPVVTNLGLQGIYDGAVRNDSMPQVRDQLEVKRKVMEKAANRLGTWEK